MDPIATIKRMHELARDIINCTTDDTYNGNALVWGDELAELVINLANWRMSGGFDPYDRANR